jgi:CDP-glucose 4,6-dehydratase
LIRELSPDVVFHLAAQPLVLTSYVHPEETYETNVIGTLNVLQAVGVTPSVQSTVVVTTDKVYRQEVGARHAFVETDPLGAADPYSTSKAMADLMSQAWMLSNTKSRLGIARAGNVIGGGDVAENRLLPDLIKAFQNNQEAKVRNPESIRPWQHVLDCLSGYLLLSEALVSGDCETGAFNFGPAPQNPLSVREVADIASATWGNEARWISEPMEQPHESKFLILDSSKSESLLCWRDKLSFRDAVEWTVGWSKQVYSGRLPRAILEEQIANYFEI